jgi:hypothetical protein
MRPSGRGRRRRCRADPRGLRGGHRGGRLLRGGLRTRRARTVEQSAHALDQGLRLEGLGDVPVGAALGGALSVVGLERPGEEQHRNLREVAVGADRGAELVAGQAGHRDVGQDQIGPELPGAGEGVVAVVHGHELHVLVGERDPDDLLDRHAVVGEKQRLRHRRGTSRQAAGRRLIPRPYRKPQVSD